MPTLDDIEAQTTRLKLYRQNLALYMTQRAQLGAAFIPPGVANGIVESRSQIRLIKRVLRDWGVTVEDHPDDEDPSDRVTESVTESPVTTDVPSTTIPNTEILEEYRERVEFLPKLISTHRRRLHALEEREALFGFSTPPEISNEIEDIRHTIAELTKELEDLQNLLATSQTRATPMQVPVSESQPIRRLRAFLCHSSGDKPTVRDLYKKLLASGIQAWLDEEEILPGQDWELEISKAVRNSDVFIVCLSQRSFTKAGFIHKEIKYALDVASIQPEGIIFIIPLKIEECEVPETLRKWQWLNYYEDTERGYKQLLRALKIRANDLGINL